jgi:hypothetical protein
VGHPPGLCGFQHLDGVAVDLAEIRAYSSSRSVVRLTNRLWVAFMVNTFSKGLTAGPDCT